MTGANDGMNPLNFGSSPADNRIWIRISSEAQIRTDLNQGSLLVDMLAAICSLCILSTSSCSSHCVNGICPVTGEAIFHVSLLCCRKSSVSILKSSR